MHRLRERVQTLMDLCERLFAAWRAGDVAAALRDFTPDAIYHEAGKVPLRGRETIAEHWSAFFTSDRIWRFDVGEIFGDASGERWVVTFTWAMQVDGAWRERPGCAVVHLRDGAIKQWREYAG